MTTIACNLEQMAADSAVVMGDTRALCCKVSRIKDALVGYAGDSALGEKFLHWLRNGGDKPAMDKDAEFCALVLTKAGIHHYEYDCEATLLKNEFWAIGTGGLHALTAMNLGCSPEGAVEQAIAFDINSAGPVDVLTLKGQRAHAKAK